MLINITIPKKVTYGCLRLRTKKYYNLNNIVNVFGNRSLGYYIFLKKRNLQIQIEKEDRKVIEDIQSYLEYMFKDSYIGIAEEQYEIFDLKGVKKISL